MKNKRDGFTLVEIIAVIIIIGIIALIAIPAVLQYLNSASDSVFTNHEKTMASAAKNYTINCLNNNLNCSLPDDGGNKKVDLKTLSEEGYIDEIVDPETNIACDTQNSYVIINKDNNDYSYDACLVCDSYKSTNSKCDVDSIPPRCGNVSSNKSDWGVGNETITVSCIDDESGCTKGTFSKVFSATDTLYFIEISDATGNKTQCDVSSNVHYDNGAPVCSINAQGEVYEDGIYYGDVKAILTAEDNESGVASFKFSNGVDVFTDKKTIDLGVGETHLTGQVTDKSNNTSSCDLIVVKNRDFVVRYDDNGGSLCSDKTLKVTYKRPYNKYGNLCTPEKVGNTFNGWYLERAFTTIINNSSIFNKKEDITLYAKWNPNTYTIKFNGNGSSSGTMNTITCTYGEGCTLSANTFAKTGYKFMGWSESSSATSSTYTDKQVVNNLTSENNKTINLYAVWKVSSYTLTFNSNGGSGSMTSQTCQFDANCKIKNNTFTKAGYAFAGWSTSSNGSVVYTDGATVKDIGNTTLYAKWIGPYKCIRATTLHSGSAGTYGNYGTKGVLKSGDAFDCDVNGDGSYNSSNERFYFVSDYYDTSTKKWDTSYAVLIFYSNTRNGSIYRSPEDEYYYPYGEFSYDTSRNSANGPRNLVKHFPTTTTWKNVSLKKTSRQILTEKSTNTVSGTSSATLPSNFSYSGKAARLLTAQEISKACGNIAVPCEDTGYGYNTTCYNTLQNCSYFMEGDDDWWLENPSDYSDAIKVGSKYSGRTTTSISVHSTDSNLKSAGVRPAIEVKKSDILY